MNAQSFSQKPREGIISAFSAGVFLILLGAIFVITPKLFDSTWAFFTNFDIVQVPNVPFRIIFPAPRNPANHTTVYSAASQFCFAWGIFLAGLFLLRIFARSPLRKKAETTSDIVFWLATGFLVGKFLNESTTTVMWFAFWAAIIMLIGLSLIIRAVILAVFR